jgi:hypothetical protein
MDLDVDEYKSEIDEAIATIAASHEPANPEEFWHGYTSKELVVANRDIVVLRNDKGRGCYAKHAFKKGDLIEDCPVIAMPHCDGGFDVLQHYVWGWKGPSVAIALGLCGSLLNHTADSEKCNVISDYDFGKGTIRFDADTDIAPGDELLVCYSMFYPVKSGTQGIAGILCELNTMTVDHIETLKKEWQDGLRKRLEECPQSRAHVVATRYLDDMNYGGKP